MTITFGSLFAGIGGFDLGFERAGMVCKWQVEIDDYATKVLEKHWPSVDRFRDIRDCGKHNLQPVDVICGGPPCQPISLAGKQRGDRDERWLWGETTRLLSEMVPRYAVLENPPALLNWTRAFGNILEKLATGGFNAEWDCLPAGVFGSHFRGDRLFIVARRAASRSLRWQGQWPKTCGAWSEQQFTGLVEHQLQRCVPTRNGKRISDGVSNRTHRLRGIGNAVVPQIAEWIGERIMEAFE